MRFFKLSFFLLSLFFLTGCLGNMNPTGGNSVPIHPYYVTTEPLIVKKILVPKGTTLIYEEHLFKEDKQDEMMSEQRLIEINLPTSAIIDWGGVPITSIRKFPNSEMHGFSVYASFKQLSNDKRTKFSDLWQSCDDDLGITVKNTDDWSFNKKNISDVQSCSVLYQRYFKENETQQIFLDDIYNELMKIDSK